MSLWVRNFIVVASLLLIFVNDAEARLFQNLFNRCGTRCYYPQHNRCGHRCRKLARRYFRRCAPRTLCNSGLCAPRPRACYQDIICTEYRMVPQTCTVPVTTYQQVTVDQGSWQKVWVPRMVTRQVPRTEYRQQTSYVRQPYQVRRRVPVMAPQSTCTDCMGAQPSMMSPGTSMQPYVVPSTPTPMTVPSTVPTPTPMSSTSLDLGAYPTLAPSLAAQPAMSWGGTTNPSLVSSGPILAPNPAVLQMPQTQSYSEMQTITSQNAYIKTQTSYDDIPARTAAAKGAFSPAPSAATVWNTPRRQRLN